MSKINRIFLDLDDVCNMFTMHALKRLGCPVEADQLEAFDPAWGFDLARAASALHPEREFTPQELWAQLKGPSVWADAPESPEFRPLLAICKAIVGLENTYFLTTPVDDPHCSQGKHQWILEHAPEEMHRNFFITPNKQLLARPECLLIDDSDSNIEAFRGCDGEAITLPRPWNSKHEFFGAPLEHVYSAISRVPDHYQQRSLIQHLVKGIDTRAV